MYELLRRSIIAIIFHVLTVLVCSMADDFVFAINNHNNGEVIRCIKTEREALLKFKGGLIDKYGMMSSWGKGKECCKWEGVQCNNTTGHVIGIILQGNLIGLESYYLGGEINSALLELHHLNVLDLSENQFSGTLPPEIGNLTNLGSLVLSDNQFSGIPPEIGNLTNLRSLDLSHNQFSAIPPQIGNLINLESLDLHHNQLSAIPPQIGNLDSLHLSHNINFSSISLPWELWNLTSLDSLDLSSNQLSEIVHPRLWRLTNLNNIDLSGNNLTSAAIDSLFHLGTNYVVPSLRRLNLDGNKLKRFPSSIWQFSMLEQLTVSSNSLMEGTITEAELNKLPNLWALDLSYGSLTFNISPDWTPPFQLSEILLSGCKVGPHFPLWLRTQSNYMLFDLSNSSISGEVPNWFWNLSSEADAIKLSHNQLNGTISNFSTTGFVDLSFNKFRGPMPLLSPTTRVLLISQNMFSGSLLFNCSLIFHNLFVLDLYNNQLSGNLHNCWENMPHLMILELANNSFSGEIPHAFGYLFNLQVLFLANNDLYGKLPSTLKECSNLQLIDIGDNMLNGSIPTWIGEYHESMGYLILRNNRFNGSIPPQICYLSRIQVLDLSGNNISGKIPTCFSNLTSLISEDTFLGFELYVDINNHEYSTIIWKGTESKYGTRNLGLLKLIDLSRNILDGNIPKAFSSLKALHSLNLSRNRLTGMIDPDIGEMSSLESLDLSSNRLSGVIPDGMALLNFLSVLDLSNNSLSGKIPIGRQLQLFNASAYVGNIGLCGNPLQPCPGDRPDPPTNNGAQNVDEEDDGGILSLYFLKDYGIPIILGFVFGFWGVAGSLIVKGSWRRVFYNFWDDVGDWLYVRVTIFWTKLRRSSS